MTDLKHKWKQHKEEQMKRLEPWHWKALQKLKEKHKLLLRRNISKVSKKKQMELENLMAANAELEPPEPTPDPKKLKLKEKLGSELVLKLRDPMNKQYAVKFYSNGRMLALMTAAVKKLNITLSEAKFSWKGTDLTPNDTPSSLGLLDDEILDVDSPTLRAKAEKAEAARKEALRRGELKEKTAQHDAKIKLERAKKRLITARRVSKVQREQRKAVQLRKKNMINLRFANRLGKEITMVYKRENWLGPLFNLVSNRFGLEPTRITLVDPSGHTIGPHDSITSLGLKDNDLVQVKFW